MSAPEPTPRERAASLRAGADECARAQLALQRAERHVMDEIDQTWSAQTWEMRGTLERIKQQMRVEAQRLERDA